MPADEVHNQEDGPAELSRILQGALESAREPLFDRVLELLHALLAGTWASWLRGDKVCSFATPCRPVYSLNLLVAVDETLMSAS